MIMKLIKEVCEPCSRPINIGQAILECEACNLAIHTRCYKSAGFCPANSLWVCKTCSLKITPRYNPFEQMLNCDSEKFYDRDCDGEEESIRQISDILNNCKSYSIKEFNKAIQQLGLSLPTNPQPKPAQHQKPSNSTQLSTYFINIDGNTTNFDSLLVELERINHKFSVIGITETNTDKPLQDLFQIPGYNSFYQSTIGNKLKGTGVALYVANFLNAEEIDYLGLCTPDIESLFIRVSLPLSNQALTFGVIYRPPSGSFQNFIKEFEHICTLLPKSGVRLIGDYNADLLKIDGSHGSGNPSIFEESFIKAGLTPVISIPTHTRINCKPSCIDNILTSDTDKIVLSGCINDQIGEHLPIFEFTNIKIKEDTKHAKNIKYYEFSNENIRKFVIKLEHDLAGFEISNLKFSDFTDIFGKALDFACKLQKPKVTKRTTLNNPWITESIVTAVDRKHELKDIWVKSINKECPQGNAQLYDTFTNYRRVLKYVINSAKHLYDCNRISEHKTDRKKNLENH